jgi:hypothetical protein
MDNPVHITDAVTRLKEIFSRIPGTRLTVADAARLSGLDRQECELVLTALEGAGFLKRRYERPVSTIGNRLSGLVFEWR